ncbi:zinc-binding dehydrogenase [Methanococcoides sp. SA1]|nr:zinc-binding dehydrogenase [Methanococcoides sp. SA1]
MTFDNVSTTFDFVFDTVGKLSASKIKKLGYKNSKYATTGFNFRLIIQSIFSKSFKLINVKPNAELLQRLKEFIEANSITPIISKEWTIDNIKAAHKDFENEIRTGKIIVKIK